jgi:hypothetical protein
MTRPPESPCCRGRKALLQALRSNPFALCPPAAKEPTPAAYATAARTHSTAAPDPNRLPGPLGSLGARTLVTSIVTRTGVD